MAIKKTCAERIKEGMAMRGISQADLVRATGISKSQISYYVSGRYVPKQDATYFIAKALNVNEAWLMGYDVSPDRIKQKPSQESVKLSAQFSAKFLKLDERDQQVIMDMIDAMIHHHDSAK